MKYLYSKEQIDKAIKRIRRFRRCKVYLSDHFANGLNTVIEVCGLSDNYKDKDDLKRIEKINKILSEELGENARLECYDWRCHVCYVGEDDKPQKGSKYNPIILDGKNLFDYPDPIILKIQNLWKELAQRDGEPGTNAWREHMDFSYKGKFYVLKPLDNIQDSICREKYADQIKILLESIGCENVQFNYGRMD